MARRHRERAYFRRLELIKDGRDYDVRRTDPLWRVSRYRQEFRAGVNLAVRRRRHNANANKGD